MAVLGAQKDWDGAGKVLRWLVEIATHVNIFFKPKLEDVSRLMVQVGKTAGVEDGIKRLVLSFFVHMASDCPVMVCASKSVIPNAVNLALSLMLDIEDEPQWGFKNDPEIELSAVGTVLDDDNFTAGHGLY